MPDAWQPPRTRIGAKPGMLQEQYPFHTTILGEFDDGSKFQLCSRYESHNRN